MANRYKDNVIVELRRVLSEVGPVRSAIDVGSGDGYYAARLMEQGLIEKITPLEVQLRDNSELVPMLYDGNTLPFADRYFELSYSIDVIHHSTNPQRTLEELAAQRAMRSCARSTSSATAASASPRAIAISAAGSGPPSWSALVFICSG
jgi:SAM-dependent methyltransferase